MQEPSIPNPASKPDEATATAPKQPCILVMDDEPEVAQEVADGLSDEGFDVQVTGSVDETLAALQRAGGAVQVIVADIRMPGAGGLDLAQMLREPRTGPGAVEIVLITGHGRQEDREAATALGALEFIRKPFRLSELIPAVNRALERVQHRRSASDSP